jgi:hypothetical protein
MADNIQVTPGTGASIAADDIGGNLHQRVKLTWGPNDTANEVDIATGKPMPIQLRSATGADLIKTTAPAPGDPALVVTISPDGVNTNGQKAMAASAPVVIANNQSSIPVAATLTAETTKVVGTVNISAGQTVATTNVPLTNFGAGKYEFVSVAVTSMQTLGPTGALGDYLAGVLIIPTTLSPGAIAIKDGSEIAMTVFLGGASSVSNLVPFFIPLGMVSRSGAWQMTTGTGGAAAIGIGNFT